MYINVGEELEHKFLLAIELSLLSLDAYKESVLRSGGLAKLTVLIGLSHFEKRHSQKTRVPLHIPALLPASSLVL